MRSGGITRELEELLRRADPAAHVLVETAVVAHEDGARRLDQWSAAARVGVSVSEDGIVRLTPTNATVIEHAVSDNFLTEDLLRRPGLDAGPWKPVRIMWGGTEDDGFEIRSISARLHPQRDGGQPKTVATWRCQMFSLAELPEGEGAVAPHDLVPISGIIDAEAVGITEGDYTFDFSTEDRLPRPKMIAPPGGSPVTYVFIWGVQADGSPATNIGLRYDSAQPSVDSGSNILQLQDFYDLSLNGLYEGPTTGSVGTPRIGVIAGGYTAGSVEVTLNLGAIPANPVQFLGRGTTRGGSSINWLVRNDADSAWVAWVDGETDEDLAGVGKRQTYRIRLELAANAAGDITPEILEVAIREVERVELHELASLSNAGTRVDPVELFSQISTPKIQVILDGERDYRDAASDLLAGHYLQELEFDVYVGASALDRQYWLYVDRYFVEDAEFGKGAITFECTNVLSKIRQVLPVWDPVSARREPLEYTNQSLKAVSDAILQDEVALAARLVGPGIDDDVTLVTKTISDSDAKKELDQLARIAGGAFIASQGRITFRRFFADRRAIAAIFPAEEIEIGTMRLGAKDRRPEYFVRYGWDQETKSFAGEVRAFSAAGLLAFDPHPLDDEPRLDEDTCKWIPDGTLAGTVATRFVGSLGTGLLVANWRSTYAYPELEPGDVVALRSDRFVAKDPHSQAAIRGQRWLLCRIVTTDGPRGREFGGWIQSYTDILPAETDIEHVGFASAPPAPPRITRVQQSQGAGTLTTDVTFQVEDDSGLGGTLKVWVAKTSRSSADPTAAEDGTLAVATTPATVGPATTFALTGGGNDQLLNEILNNPRQQKLVYAEFLNSKGRSSGVVAITLQSFLISIAIGTGKVDPGVTLADGKAIFRKGAPGDPDDARSIKYQAGATLESLKPSEAGAEKTAGKSLTVLQDRTAANIAESAGRKWAAESGADVTGSHQAASIAGQGALATKDSVDLSSTEVTHKLASNISFASGASVESLKPAEAGAQKRPAGFTGGNAAGIWNGSGTDFTVTWGTENTTTETIEIQYYRAGLLVATDTGVTNDGNQSRTVSGGSSSDKVYVVLKLVSGTSVIDSIQTSERNQGI